MSAAPLVLDKATIMDFLDVSAEYFAMDTLRDAFVSRISFCEAAHPCNKADPPARILHLGGSCRGFLVQVVDKESEWLVGGDIVPK
jgi:hypothetical protein